MFINPRRCLFFLVLLLFTAVVSARQHSLLNPNQPSAHKILLDVVVTPKSGPPATGLQQQDFTLLDNKVPQTITSFQAVDGRQAPIEVVLVVDAVNTGYQNLSYERNQIEKFLRADGGNLAHPTSFAVLTDTGIQIQEGSTSDGNALSASLDQYTIGLRNRAAGMWGAFERLQVSLDGLSKLAERESARPGRKVILWISPGWPLLSGPNVGLDAKQQQRLFDDIVSLSTQFLQARITLYSIDPLGTSDNVSRAMYWQGFVKGISKPSQVQVGNLALQVLATQSGGVALTFSNDVAALLQKCLADTAAYYEISFDPPIGDRANEYHHLEIRVAEPGLTPHARQGYYSQP
jgi:VWFA-related protein